MTKFILTSRIGSAPLDPFKCWGKPCITYTVQGTRFTVPVPEPGYYMVDWRKLVYINGWAGWEQPLERYTGALWAPVIVEDGERLLAAVCTTEEEAEQFAELSGGKVERIQ